MNQFVKTVLVVEDEMPLLKVIKAKLESSGFQVVTARSARGAINVLEDLDSDVDVLWFDHYLGGDETGLDLAKKIKADDRWKDKPLFIVSVTAGPDVIEDYYKLGITRFYTKHDFRIQNIINDIKAVIEK